MTCQDRKQKLYELGKKAVMKITSRQTLGYVCPICLRCFENLDELTEEHVPPESIGGEVLCLTCRECNCIAGYSVDAQVQREQLSRTFIVKNGRARKAKLIVGDAKVNIDLRFSEQGGEINILGDQNDPKVVETLKPILKEIIQSGKSFNLRDIVSYSRKAADIGYLKTAYLAAFAKFGYSYILRPALNRVRQQIKEPSLCILNTVRVYGNVTNIPEKVFILLQEPISCLSVKADDSIVCLPLPYGDDLFYEKLAEMRANGRIFEWRGNATIEWPRRFELALDLGNEV